MTHGNDESDFIFGAVSFDSRLRESLRRRDDRNHPAAGSTSKPIILKVLEYPTEIIEEGFVRAQIESVNGEVFARITWPKREIEEETLIRLELKSLSLWHMTRECEP